MQEVDHRLTRSECREGRVAVLVAYRRIIGVAGVRRVCKLKGFVQFRQSSLVEQLYRRRVPEVEDVTRSRTEEGLCRKIYTLKVPISS